jgi:hypothetical protein
MNAGVRRSRPNPAGVFPCKADGGVLAVRRGGRTRTDLQGERIGRQAGIHESPRLERRSGNSSTSGELRIGGTRQMHFDARVVLIDVFIEMSFHDAVIVDAESLA